MAEFNPQTSVTVQNGWIGASDGQIPNRAFGTLFEGAGEIMKRREKAKEDRLQSDVQRKVDELDDEIVGKDLPPSLFEKSPDKNNPMQSNDAPLALVSAGSKLGKLKTAYEQGTLSDRYYMARVRELSKSLRADYPQFTDKIDDLLSNAIGTSSANALRKEFNSQFDAETASMSDELKKTHSLISSNLKYVGDVEVASFYKAVTGKDLDYNNIEGINHGALIQAFGARASDDARRAREDAAIDSLGRGTEASKNLAKKTATKRAIEISDSSVFVATINGLGKLVQDKLKDDGKLSPEEMIEIEKASAEIEISLGSRISDLLKEYPEINDDKDRKDIEAIAFRSFNVIRDALKNSNLSTVKFLTDQVTAKKMLIDVGIFDDTDHLIAFGKTVDKFGQGPTEAAYLLFHSDREGRFKTDRAAQAIMGYYFGQNMAGESPSELLRQGVKHGSTKELMPAFESYITVLSNEITTPEQTIKAVETLFSKKEEGLLDDLDPKSAERLFNLMMNPALQAKIKGSPSAKLAYRWAFKVGPNLLNEAASNIVEAQKYTDNATVVYDKGRFDIVDARPANLRPSYDPLKTGSLRYIEDYSISNGKEAIRRMNSFVDKMRPLIEANGDTVESFLTKVFRSEDYENLHKEGSFFTRMGVALEEMNKTMDKNMEEVDKNSPKQPEKGSRRGSDKRSELEGNTLDLIDFLYSAEGADYETMYGGKKADLTNMKVSEVLALGKKRGKRVGSSALGAPQVVTDTLQGLIKQGVVDDEDLFTQETQDKITLALMNEKGFQKFKNGRFPGGAEAFADKLAEVWASLPGADGKSKYHGDKMNNRATVSRENLLKVLKRFET